MNLDIRLSGMVDTMPPNSAKALASTPGNGAPGESFSAMLAQLGATNTNKLPAVAGDTAVPESLLSDLPGFHPLPADQGAGQANVVVAAAGDLPPALPPLAGKITSHAESGTAATAAVADIQTDEVADALAALQSLAADDRTGVPAIGAATGVSAASPGGNPPLQSARPRPIAAAPGESLVQRGGGELPVGAGDTAAFVSQQSSGTIADSSFALADHELEQQGIAGKAANHDSGLHHSVLLPTVNNYGAAQTPVSGGVSATLASPLASTQWQQEFNQQMVSLIQRGEQRVSLHLNPAELGPLVVDLKLSEHQALLQFASAHAQVRSALEQALPQLREALAEQGISLGETQIGSERGEQQASSFRGGAHEAGHDSVRAGDKPELLPDGVGAAMALPLAGRVNLYV